MKRPTSLALAIAILLIGAAIYFMLLNTTTITVQVTPTQPNTVSAQSAPAAQSRGTVQALLTQINNDGTRATVEFAQSVARLGKSVDVGEGGVLFDSVGAEMVCFLVTGNAVDQVTCVPYTNVIGVFYEE